MLLNDFTSGPVRDLTSEELGSSVFSDFELLSDSGHNLVYRAMRDGKWVVLKFAREEEGNTTRNHLLLRREYDIMRAIDSIYVVRPWQMTDVPGVGKAIVMEYVHGRTLDAFIQEKPSYSERKRVAEELMEALISIHERQIIHGDLKGTNIIITDTGNHVRLIDFGFADADAYVAKNIGSTPSVAPSQPSTGDTADIQRDIYSFGKILALLFPRRFRFVIKRCLNGRYSSISEVRNAFRRRIICQWLLPLASMVIIVLAAIIGWGNTKSQETVPASVFVPQVDSAWLSIKEQAEKKYNGLYRLYADSLKNMTEPELGAALQMSNRYAARMVEQRDRFIAAHPEYEEPLTQQYITTYTRDLPRLEKISIDYPIIIRK